MLRFYYLGVCGAATEIAARGQTETGREREGKCFVYGRGVAVWKNQGKRESEGLTELLLTV